MLQFDLEFQLWLQYLKVNRTLLKDILRSYEDLVLLWARRDNASAIVCQRWGRGQQERARQSDTLESVELFNRFCLKSSIPGIYAEKAELFKRFR